MRARVPQHIAASLERLKDAVPPRYRRFAGSLAHELQEDRTTGLAAEIAFFGVLSIFPWLLLLTAMLGWFAAIDAGIAADAKRSVLVFLDRVLTERGSGAVSAVREVFERERIGVLTLSGIVAIWTSARGFAATIVALNLAYDCSERRSWLQLRLVSLGLALGSVVVGCLLLLAFAGGPLLGGGRVAADLLGLGDAFWVTWQWVRWALAFGVIVVAAIVVYRIAPCRAERWRDNLPGALVAATFGISASVGFGIYVRLAASGNPIYGALGGALLLLLWLYLVSFGLLLGAEVNGLRLHKAA